MEKKIIQVPVDELLLHELNKESKKQHKARAELIRTACLRYLKSCTEEEMEKIYIKGYEEIPETPEIAISQEKMLADILPEESW